MTGQVISIDYIGITKVIVQDVHATDDVSGDKNVRRCPECLIKPFRKPKNARVKRALDKREPQTVENEKTAIFVKGNQTSEKVRMAMKDLVS